MHLTVSAGEPEQRLLQQQILISNVLLFSVATFNLKVNRFYGPLPTFCSLPFMIQVYLRCPHTLSWSQHLSTPF
jgi:hypothetical protein